MCRRKHGEKAQKLVTLHQNTTKKSTYKRELALQREVRACPNQLKFHPMRFLQQYVQGYLTGSHRCNEVMVNINKIQSMYNKLCLGFTIIISPRIFYTLPHSENWFRQLHCYFVNNFTTTYVTITSFIDKFKNIKYFQSLL